MSNDPILIVGAGIIGLVLGQALKKVHPSSIPVPSNPTNQPPPAKHPI